MQDKIKRANEALAAACEKRDTAYQAIEDAPDDIESDALEALTDTFDSAQQDVERSKKEKERLERIAEARANSPMPELPAEIIEETHRHARPAGSTKEEPTYRPDRMADTSFFRDQLAAKTGNSEARDRLGRNADEAVDYYKSKAGVDYRDMANASTTGGEFVPTIYLNDLWVHPSIAGRPFADAVQSYPLPATGTTLSLPKLSSGVTVAGRSDGGAVSETDGVTASVTHDVNELAGQVDIGRINVFRSDPGLDMVIGQTLVRRYNAKLDSDMLSGSGTAPNHRGLRNVTSPNTTAYTDGTPTQAEFVPKIYSAISDIATNRSGEVKADTLVMHPRRAAWLASGLSSTFPLFAQGGMVQTIGTQDAGFTTTFCGLRVIEDANVGVLYGASTTEDEVYVLASEDFYLAEGPLFSRVFDDVGSGNGNIRYQIFAYSSFLSNRYPKSLSILSGTGLIAPTF